MEIDPGEKVDSDSEGSNNEDSREEEDESLVVLNEFNDYRKHQGLTRQYLLVTYYAILTVHSKWFNYLILLVIIIAGINVGVQTYPSMSTNPILTILDEVILTMFSIECILKIISEGLIPWAYWTGKEWKWNTFDFTIVFMSMPFWHGLFGSGSLALLWLVRLMRLGKLIKKIPALQMIVQGLLGGLKSIGYILILLFLVYYLFSVVGFYLFSENDPFNFGNIPMAMISLFRCSTLDAWSDIMYVNIYGCE